MSTLVQVGLTACGAGALLLAMGNHPARRRIAPIIGMCGQPFWICSALESGQWGVMVSVAMFTCAYAWGIYNHWVKSS